MRLTARVRREEGYWAVEVPEIDDLVVQAKRLDQVHANVAEVAAKLTRRPRSEFVVELDVKLPDAVTERVDAARELSARAAELQARASKLNRLAVAALAKDAGLPLRDIGMILGVSFQRAGQLLKEVAVQSAADAGEPAGDA